MSDMNRLEELERISLTELKFLVGCFEVCSLNFSVFVWLCRGEKIRLLWCILNFHTHICCNFHHQIKFQYKSPTSSLALPSKVSYFYQSEPRYHRPLQCLYRPQHSGQRPEAMVKSYWSLEVRVHTGAAMPGVRGQSWVGQVRLNVPALLPEAMKVRLAQFILWPRLVNSASRPSIELWFVIKFFNP